MNPSSNLVRLCVGGTAYSTTRETLCYVANSKIANWFAASNNGSSTKSLDIDEKGRYHIDRDGQLFRHILNYLRNRGVLSLPDHFAEYESLRIEAEYYGLDGLTRTLRVMMQASVARDSKQTLLGPSSPIITTVTTTAPSSTSGGTQLSPIGGTAESNNHGGGGGGGGGGSSGPNSPSPINYGGYGVVRGTGGPGFVTVGYRGSFAFGRDGLADVKFRKLTKILVSGRVTICREVFGDTLNESRDPDHGDDDHRYTARFFLKHLCLEQAFDCLQDSGFRCVGSAGSGTASIPGNEPQKPGIDSEETRWNHYNEFLFCRP